MRALRLALVPLLVASGCLAGANAANAAGGLAVDATVGNYGEEDPMPGPGPLPEPGRPPEGEEDPVPAPSPLPEPDDPPVDVVPSPAPPPTDSTGEEGELRLAGRVDINGFATGALQVFLNGAFGSVCSTNFGPPDADVACRQLGFVAGTTLLAAVVGDIPASFVRTLPMDLQEVVAPFVLENLDCSGNEERLVDCPGAMVQLSDEDFGDSTRVCDPVRPEGYTFVACGTLTGPAQGDLRLANGGASEDGNAAFGRLEVFSAGGWGSVCDSPDSSILFTDGAVNVACQQLGFNEGEKISLSTDQRPEVRRIPILLAGASCSGSEATLAECGGSGGSPGDGTEQCDLSDALTLACFQDRQPGLEGSLRLMDGGTGPGYEYGRLEIFVRGLWSTICDDPASVTPDTANLACRILGYGGGAALEFRRPFTDRFEPENQVLVANLPIGLASVDCDGTETSLLDCTSSQDDVRLCDTNSNFTDATVLACANSAADCPEPAPPTEGSVRLRGGFGTICDPVHTGFIEVFHNNEWGAVCRFRPTFGDKLAADVVCRQLGFPHGTLVDPTTNPADAAGDGQDYREYLYDYGPSEEAEEPRERFWLEDVSCSGTEGRLVDCRLGDGEGFLENNGGCDGNPPSRRLTVACRSFAVPEALEAVTTPGAEEGNLRLIDQTAVGNWEVGRLEIFFEGSWGQVCGNNFNKADADVACRQLGFGAGTVGPTQPSSRGFDGDRLVYPEVALASPGCSGTEERLLDCQRDSQEPIINIGVGRKGSGCFDTSGPGLMIGCVRESEPGMEGELRLTDGGDGDDPASGRGILEVFHDGAWGTVCSDDLTLLSQTNADPNLPQTAAAVACRQLGFQTGVFFTVQSVPDGVTLRPSWLGRIPCSSTVDTIAECGPLAFGETGTCGFTQRLSCNNGEEGVLGAARLVGGRTDPNGAWAYGRLEVSDGNAFRGISEFRFIERLGRKATEIACQSLGFATGAQLLAGTASGLPGTDGTEDAVGKVICYGDEDSLEDCTFGPAYDFPYENGEGAAAVLCFNPSGCTVDEAPPSQGDVRLFKLNGINNEAITSPCDDVHFGGVEFFNDGQWGRICTEETLGVPRSAFAIDALVVCRQLGFPFGSLMDVQEVLEVQASEGEDYTDYTDELVWASEVQCTGLEERLDECFFPEDFGNNEPPAENGGFPAAQFGITDSPCRFANSASSARGGGNYASLSVVCRRFAIEESDVIR